MELFGFLRNAAFLVLVVVHLVSAATIAKLPGNEYVGCYRDQAEPQLLHGPIQEFLDTLTPQLCVALCKRKGYIYAGLRYSSQCLCGDDILPDSSKVNESECAANCNGDMSVICGGTWRNTIYKTGNSVAIIAVLPGNEYVGCYRDQPEPRLLQGPILEFPDTLTPQLCVTLCKRKGYIYAGLRYSLQCLCGDDILPDSAKVNKSECSAKCTGDRSMSCGGTWRTTIYKTGNSGSSVAVIGYEYMGCYRDQVEPRLLNGEVLEFIDTLTPSLCVGVCQKKGYVYAGLQYSTHCFCGDNKVIDDYKANERDCHMKCTGDRTTICGGNLRITIYRTGNKAATIAVLPGNEYVGCYRDQAEPQLLQGPIQEFHDTLTPQLCIALCKRKGYTYAGLRYSSQCLCGDDILPDSSKVSNSDCSAKCTGDRSAFCGGTWRNTIYKTGNSAATIAKLPGNEYVGCYSDQPEPRLLQGPILEFPDTLTPQLCVTLCKRKGYIYAGLRYSSQCLCGDNIPPDSAKVSDSECSTKCTGDISVFCGGTWRSSIYKTGNSGNANKVENMCNTSVTIVNGKAACQNEVVFEDNFESLSPEKWRHTIQIANGPDYQFVIYDSDPANAYTSDGKLVIKPTLLPDTKVKNGDLHLRNCTGKPDTHECGYKAQWYVILPPVKSARLTTRKSFSFQYGKVEISAKLPAGDWLVPEIWLEPKNEVYGPGYASGRVCIAMSRGNKDLKLDGQDIGIKQLESGVLMGVGDNIRGHTVIRETANGWHNNYHNYSLVWTPENIIFMIDGEKPYVLMPSGGQTLSDVVGFTPNVTPVWSFASKLAPFDKDFYISLGISVGGVRNFPDNVINNGKPKPWKNLELKELLNFWRDKSSWQSTWHDDAALLQVDYVKVTAL